MSSLIPPLAPAAHDPNAGLSGPWTIEIPLDPGVVLIGPVTVIAVLTDGTDSPLVGDSLVLSNIAIGQISVTPNIWGISFDAEFGSPQSYWIRASARRLEGAKTYGVHRTVRMNCENN